MTEERTVIHPNDWALVWSPDAPDDESGFYLFTPISFDPEVRPGPLGGMVLSAMIYLIESDDEDFIHELVHRANSLAKKRRMETGSVEPPPIKPRTMN